MNNLSIYAWRENLNQLDNCLSLCDEIDLLLKERAKEKKYIYATYVNIKELNMRGSQITINFEAREMEFYILEKIQKIVYDHGLEMVKNTHEYKSSYMVTLTFEELSKDEDEAQ
jgi:uncharacterized protein involved in tolerance to divalent cations